MSKPIAVLISDIHYSLPTLALADSATRQAVFKANELKVPLIVAGDLHDSKANLRAECVNAMLETFDLCTQTVFILVGNHDKIHEKSEDNALWFLNREPSFMLDQDIPSRYVVSRPRFVNDLGAINGNSIHLIPYQHDKEELRKYLSNVDKNSCIIMHQGIQGSNSGDYIQDHSAITKDDVSDFRVISGHYHQRQNIKTGQPRPGEVGTFSYIGNSYTLNFGEASDPDKGFQILNSDGSLTFIPTNLRKHVVLKIADGVVTDTSQGDLKHDDLVLVKVYGTKEELGAVNAKQIAKKLLLPGEFKLELIATDLDTRYSEKTATMSHGELLDDLIDSKSSLSDNKKQNLKNLWKELK